jgi:hypothetical protein
MLSVLYAISLTPRFSEVHGRAYYRNHFSGSFSRREKVRMRAFSRGYIQSAGSTARGCLLVVRPRWVSFCKRFSRLDTLAFAAELIRSIKRIPLR